MGVFHILWAIIVGFIIGLFARAVMPGAQHLGFMMTTIIGIAGSFFGAFLGNLISKPEPGSKFHPAGFFMSIVGALVLLFVLRLIS
jgi:Transglycosylase associated protein.